VYVISDRSLLHILIHTYPIFKYPSMYFWQQVINLRLATSKFGKILSISENFTEKNLLYRALEVKKIPTQLLI